MATHEGEQDGDSSAGKEELGATPRPVGVVEGKEEAEPAQHSGASHALLDPFEPSNTTHSLAHSCRERADGAGAGRGRRERKKSNIQYHS